MIPTPQTIPTHVPAHLVRDFDMWEAISAAGKDGHARAARMHEEMPAIFYTPRMSYLGGAWIPRRAEDLRRIMQDTDTFSSANYTPFPQMLGEAWRLIPLEIDPPEHAKYRALINPLFSPRRVDELEPAIRAQATALIDEFAAKGRCDFNADFAEWFPTQIFLRLMGWPTDQAATFVGWTQTLIKSQDMGQVVGAVAQVRDYLRKRIADSRRNDGTAPTDDFISYLFKSEVDGRPLTDDEIFGYCFLIFIAGLDTVTSSLGFIFMHLARNPAQQADLRAKPDRIPQAVEEMLRAYSIVNSRRTVTQDAVFGEVTMKKGDFVMLPSELGNLDPEQFECPIHVDFDRENAQLHMAFSNGPHRCAGSHLARRELRIAVELWLQKVPVFRMDESKPVAFRASGVFGVDGLHLTWA